MRVWDLDTGALEHTLAGHDGMVQAVAVSADGRRAVSGGDGGTVLVVGPFQWQAGGAR